MRERAILEIEAPENAHSVYTRVQEGSRLESYYTRCSNRACRAYPKDVRRRSVEVLAPH